MESENVTPLISISDIKHIIAHEVLREQSQNKFILNSSESEVQLLPQTKAMILHKLGELLPKTVPMKVGSGNEVTDIVKRIPGMGLDEFIEESKIIAEKLKDAQSGKGAKAGVLILMQATDIDGQNVVLVVKSEFGEGIRASFENGNKTVIELLNNIIFTKTSYYKIGAFLHAKGKWHCRLWDSGARLSKTQTAKYFHIDFLKLDMMHDNAMKTLNFYKHSKKFINLNYKGLNILDKMKFLFAYLKSSETFIEIDKFAETHLLNNKNAYIKYMLEEAKLSGNFVKDMRLTEKFLKVRQINFDGGININVPYEKYGLDCIVLSDKDIQKVAENGEHKDIQKVAENDERKDIQKVAKNDEQWTYVKIKGEAKSEK